MKWTLLSGLVFALMIFILFVGPANADSFTANSNATQMKTIGVIGGVSWQSSIEYYRLMNEIVNEKLGGLHSAKILMFSIEFGDFSKDERLAERGNWTALNKTIIDAATRLKMGGADFIVIASNTINSRADYIQEELQIPVLHIADATGERVNSSGSGQSRPQVSSSRTALFRVADTRDPIYRRTRRICKPSGPGVAGAGAPVY